jgi:polysaccharide chain length determinant protein (PEP-CTERM system associated)
MNEHAVQAAPKGAGLSAVLEAWRRRRWPAIFIFAAVCTGVASAAVFLPNVYQSTATILIERQQVPEAFVQTTVTSGVDIRLQTITQQVLSRSRLEGLINRFGLYSERLQVTSLEEVIARMRADILLEQKGVEKRTQTGTTVAFTISYKGNNPQQVAQVTNELASFYIDENLKVREQQAAGTADFLRTQLEEVRQRLEEQEKHLSQFKERNMGELPDQLQANIAALERLNTQLRLNGEKRARAADQRTALAQQLAELEGLRPSSKTTIVIPDPKVESDAVRLEKLQQDLTVLRKRFNDNYPEIGLLKAQIEALEEQLAAPPNPKKKPGQTPDLPLNPYVQQLKRELSALEVEMKALHIEEQNTLQGIATYQQKVENTPRRDQELQILHRDYDTAKALYQSLLKRQEEAKLAQHLEQRQKGEQFRLLEPAAPSVKPIEPKRSKLLLTGCMGALAFAVGTIVLAEQLNTSFHTVDELRAFTPVPVLVSLPRIVTRAEARRRRWRFGLAGFSAVLILVLIVVTSYAVIKMPAQLVDLYVQLQRLGQ